MERRAEAEELGAEGEIRLFPPIPSFVASTGEEQRAGVFPFEISLVRIKYISLGQAWAKAKQELVTCRLRADSGWEPGQKVRRHSLDRLLASMNQNMTTSPSTQG